MTDPYSQQPQDPYAPQPTPQPFNPYQSPQQPAYGYSGQPPQNSLALVSLILSLAGLLTWITAPIGAILGHIALKQIRQTGEAGEGMAKAGIIVGWILTGLVVLVCCGIAGFMIIGASTSSIN